MSPSPEFFGKNKLETIHFGAYLRQTFEINDNLYMIACMVRDHVHLPTSINKSILNIFMSGNCLILLNVKHGRVPQKLKPFDR